MYNNNNNINNNMTESQVFRNDMAQAILLSQKQYEKEQEQRRKIKQKEKDEIEKLRQRKELEQKKLLQKTKISKYFSGNSSQSQLISIPLNGRDAYSRFLNVMEWQNKFNNYGGMCGLANLGNSCFMNSVLQCLAYTAPFSQLLLQSYHKPICKKRKSKQFCSLCCIENLLPLMITKKATLSPVALFRNLPKINDFLTPGCQEDASEYLTSLLDKLEQEYDNTCKGSKTKKDPFNPIRELFTGLTKTRIMCGGCQNENIIEEEYYHLSLDVDEAQSVKESLTVLSHDELMKGDDKYFCDKCNKKRLARKKVTISKLPPILIFHLKRFVVNSKTMKINKINDFVEFDEIIDFGEESPYIHKDDLQKFKNGDRKYKLFGVLVHSGPKLGYGHYYSYIRAPNNKFYQMNDKSVLSVPTKRVLKEKGYLLFYKKTTNNDFINKLKEYTFNNNSESSSININNNNNNIQPTVSINLLDRSLSHSSHSSKSSSSNDDEKVKDYMVNNDYFESNNCNETNNNNINSSNNNNNNKTITPTKITFRTVTLDDSNNLSSSPYVKVPKLSTVPINIKYNLDSDVINNNSNDNEEFQNISRKIDQN